MRSGFGWCGWSDPAGPAGASSPSARAGAGWLAWTGAAGVVDVKKFWMPRPAFFCFSPSRSRSFLSSGPLGRPLVLAFFRLSRFLHAPQSEVTGMLRNAGFIPLSQLLWFGGETIGLWSTLKTTRRNQELSAYSKLFPTDVPHIQSSFPRTFLTRKSAQKSSV